jgi:DNA polymerase-3 subunit chi
MTPKIDFYLLDRHVADGRLRAACRLCKKIHALGHRIYVRTPDLEQAKALDDLMWTFDQSSFVPHGLYDPERSMVEVPVAIGQQPPSGGNYNVLVTLLDTVPDDYDEFPRVAELVDNTPEDKARARDRYRWYRTQGCDLQKHDITI